MYPKKDLREYLTSKSENIISKYHKENKTDKHVYDFIPNYDVDYPFITVGEMFETPVNDRTRTTVTENVIIHVFNYHEKIRETEDIVYELTKELYENLKETHYDWSILDGYKADSLFEFDDKKNEILSHVVIDISFTNK